MIGDANAKKYFYHTDHVGSVRAVTDDVGKVVWKADYLAFGMQFGKDKLDLSFEEDEFAFTGKGFDGDTGLYYYNARWYDAETGRFMSEDPAGIEPNCYNYCRNRPVICIDRDGRVTTLAGALVGGFYGLASTAAMDVLNGERSSLVTYASNTLAGILSGAYAASTGDPLGTSFIYATISNGLPYAIETAKNSPPMPITNLALKIGFDTALGYFGGVVGSKFIPRGPGREPTKLISSLTGKIGQKTLWGQGAVTGAQDVWGNKLWDTMGENGWLNSPSSTNSSQNSSSGSVYNNGMDNISNNIESIYNTNGVDLASILSNYTIQVIKGKDGFQNWTLNENGEFVFQGGYWYVEGGYLNVDADGKTTFTSDEEADGKPYTGPWTEGKYTDPNNTGSGSNEGSGSTEGSGSSSSGGKIICVELYRQGLMSKEIFEADENFGRMLKEKYPLVLKGYQFWARLVVAYMKKSKSFTKMVYKVAKPWSFEMAHIMGVSSKGNFVGKILMLIGFPICWVIGFVIINKSVIILLILICVALWLINKYKRTTLNFKQVFR